LQANSAASATASTSHGITCSMKVCIFMVGLRRDA